MKEFFKKIFERKPKVIRTVMARDLISPLVTLSGTKTQLEKSAQEKKLNKEDVRKRTAYVDGEWKERRNVPYREDPLQLDVFHDQKTGKDYELVRAHKLRYRDFELDFDHLPQDEEKLMSLATELFKKFEPIANRFALYKQQYEILRTAPFSSLETAKAAHNDRERALKELEKVFRDFAVLRFAIEQLAKRIEEMGGNEENKEGGSA